MVRTHIIFTGRVQGVGFRYTTQNFANTLRIKGWVKNLSDGRVEMMAEGTREQLDNLIYKLDKHFGEKIQSKDIDWMDARHSFNSFDVTY